MFRENFSIIHFWKDEAVDLNPKLCFKKLNKRLVIFMNLSEVKLILEHAQGHLYFERQDMQRAGSTAWRFFNLNRVRNAINEIERTGLFRDHVIGLLSSDILTSAGDTTVIEPTNARNTEELISQLRVLVGQFLIAIKPIVPEVEPNSLVITIPNVSDFDDLSQISHTLQKAIGQVVINNEIQGKVEITSVENGSIIFVVDLGSIQALSLIGSLVTIALGIHYRILSTRALEAKAKIANVNNERHKKLVEQEQEFIELYAEIELDQIRRQYAANQDGDYAGRLKNSILLFRELQDKGAEIKPAIKAPEEVKKSFPTKALIESVGQITHLLENQKLLKSEGDGSSSLDFIDSDVKYNKTDGTEVA